MPQTDSGSEGCW